MRKSASLLDASSIIIWVLVADNHRAEIFACAQTTRLAGFVGFNKHHFPREETTFELVPLPNGVIRSETIGAYQTGRGVRGMDMNSATAKRTTYEPKGDILKELRRGYIQAIADQLQRAALENKFHKLVLVSPARLISDLKERLPPIVRSRITAEIPKDLAHAPKKELVAQVLDVVADKQTAFPQGRA